MRVCLALTIILAICPPCVAVSEVNAQEHDPEAIFLLEEAARRSANIATLSARFQQEKKLSILTQPMISQGYMCVARPRPAQNERLLWAYTTPAPSGFIYENGRGALWETSPADKRPAGSQEDGVITAIVRHILAWIQIDSEALQQTYRLKRPEKDLPVLLLYPKQQSFFIKLEVEFAPSLDRVRQLTFSEANNDTMRIMFTDIQINQPLPERCAQ